MGGDTLKVGAIARTIIESPLGGAQHGGEGPGTTKHEGEREQVGNLYHPGEKGAETSDWAQKGINTLGLLQKGSKTKKVSEENLKEGGFGGGE